MYQEGKGVKQDYKQAAEWYRKAALQGQVDALNSLALLYFEGQGVKKDYATSYGLFLLAAESGDDFAKDSVGEFERGLDISDRMQGEIFAMDWKLLIREDPTEFTNIIGGDKTSFTIRFKKERPENCASKFEMFRFFTNWFNQSSTLVFCSKDKKDRTRAVTVRKGKGHGIFINRNGSMGVGAVNPAECAGPMKTLLYFAGFGKDEDLVFC